MADAALARNAPNAIDDIVRGEGGGLIQHKDCVDHSPHGHGKLAAGQPDGWKFECQRGEMPYDVNAKIPYGQDGARKTNHDSAER